MFFLLSITCFAQEAEKQAMLLETIPFKSYTGGVIVIEAKIAGKPQPLNFILDTGSSGISLDSATCDELDIPTTATDTMVSGIAGTRKVSYVFDQNFTTGKLVTEHINFYVNDYSLLSSVYGDKIDGIVGYSFLSRYILKINFDSNSIKIYSPGSIKYNKRGTLLTPSFNRLITLPLEIKEKQKIIANFFLDTGAGLSLMLTDGFVKENNLLLPRRRPVTTQVQGLGGKKLMRLTVVRRLKFGPYVFRNVPTNLYNDEGNSTFYPRTAGLLGNDIMRRFNITLNYPASEVHITPNNSFNDEFDYAYTGMSLYNYENKIIIDDVISNSPAEKAGIMNNDEVLGVSGNLSGEIQAYEKLLQKVNEPVKVLIRRNGKIIFISMIPVSIR